jgi:hypothetical protein
VKIVRRDCTYGHTYSKVNQDIFNCDVFCTLSNLTALVSWLNCDCIIMSRNGEISYNNICP